MARRAPSATQLVVDYFMNGDLPAVEQALVIAGSIVSNRRAKETSVALTAPRRRNRTKTPAAAPVAPPAAATAAPAATVTPIAPAAQAPKRTRTRTPAAPADGQPRRRRGRPAGTTKTTGATPPLPSSGPSTSAIGDVPPATTPLPDQGELQGDDV